jgi:hypothetical protein
MPDNHEAGEKATRTNIPPYVPYRTFLTFLEGLKVGVPSHIDKSVLKSMSGAIQSWLKASLRYMKLIDAESVPQDMLYSLSRAEGDARKKLMKELFESTYDFLRQSVELEYTTPAKLESAFVQTGATGETVRKCIAFMIAMARDAEVELSPHLLKRGAMPRRPRQARTRNGASASAPPLVERDSQVLDQNASASDWMDQLLGKFPTFDPSWPDEVKVKWFEGFERLMNARK